MAARKKSPGVLDGDGATAIARFMQIVGMPILLFISGWMFNTLNDVSSRVVRLEEKVQAASDDRYRGSQAAADFRLRDAQISGLLERVQNNEQRFIATGQRMNSLEERLNRLDHQGALPH